MWVREAGLQVVGAGAIPFASLVPGLRIGPIRDTFTSSAFNKPVFKGKESKKESMDTSTGRPKVPCHFENLGRRAYREVWDLQERTLEEVKQAKLAGEKGQNRLFFVEHEPVYTIGRSGKDSNMLAGAALLQAKHAEFIHVDRGGDVTYHGPGQLVGYPIFNLEELGLGVKAYVDGIEESIIRSMARYGIVCERLAGATGVWLEPHTPRARKICAIGVKCSRYVTMHGFALNVNTDLSYFNLINPCGFTDKGVTSMRQELGRELDFEEVCRNVQATLAEVFSLEYC